MQTRGTSPKRKLWPYVAGELLEVRERGSVDGIALRCEPRATDVDLFGCLTAGDLVTDLGEKQNGYHKVLTKIGVGWLSYHHAKHLRRVTRKGKVK